MDASDDFYIYLYSESNKDTYKNNKGSRFTNVINPPLKLSDVYNVAVENVIFKPRIICIPKNDEKYKIELFFRLHEADDVHLKIEYVPSIDMIGKDIQNIITLLAIDFKECLRSKYNILTRNKVIFAYDRVQKRARFSQLRLVSSANAAGAPALKDKFFEITWKFSPKMCDLLGIILPVQKTFLPMCDVTPKLPDPLECIYIYSDIVITSNYAGQSVHLLDIIPMEGTYSKSGTQTLYKTVSKNFLDTISVKMVDKYGEFIKFEEGTDVVIVLHFKKSF